MELIDLKFDSELRQKVSCQLRKTVSQEVKDCLMQKSVVIGNILNNLARAMKSAVKIFFLTTPLWNRDHRVKTISWLKMSDTETNAKADRILTVIRKFLKKGVAE